MTLTTEERNAIISYRIGRALSTLQEARDNAMLGHWNLVANRLYYSVFYAGSALLLSNKLAISSHAGFVRMFGLHFIKTGEIDIMYNKIIGELFRMRQTGDYDDVFDLTEADVSQYFEPVESLLTIINSKLDL